MINTDEKNVIFSLSLSLASAFSQVYTGRTYTSYIAYDGGI